MEGYHNKHYIRLDTNNCIIKGFSDAFENPDESDICINQEGKRHFELLGEINPPLFNMNGQPLYIYEDETIRKLTEEEKNRLYPITVPEPERDLQAEYLLDLDYRLSKIELGV